MKQKSKHFVAIDGTAVNKGWTIDNAKFTSQLARRDIAQANRDKKNKQIQKEIKEGKRKPVKVRVDF